MAGPAAMDFGMWIMLCTAVCCDASWAWWTSAPAYMVAVETPPEPQPQPHFSAVRFKCSLAPVQTEESCFGPKHGGCHNGTRCFIKDNYFKGPKEVHAACCCDVNATPINRVMHDHWSCYATEVTARSKTHGSAPYCDIQCCERNQSAIACFGNPPICCDGSPEVQACGITLDGKGCCATPGSTSCCDNPGTPCWHNPHGGFLGVDPSWEERRCCLRSNMDDFCVQKVDCRAAQQMFGMTSTVFAIISMMVFGRLHGWLGEDERSQSRRRCCCVSQVVAISVALSVAYVLLPMRLSPKKGPQIMVLLLTATLDALLIGALRLAKWRRRSQERRQRLQHGGETSGTNTNGTEHARLAILLNLQEYQFMNRVTDASMRALTTQLSSEASGWEVLSFGDITGAAVKNVIVDQVKVRLAGRSKADVWLYISCHAQTYYGLPQFLPTDAHGWGDGVCIFWLVHELCRINPGIVSLYIMVNGCLTDCVATATCFEWMHWHTRRAFEQLAVRLRYPCDGCSDGPGRRDHVQLLRNRHLIPAREAKLFMLFACTPGRSVSGDPEGGDCFTQHVLAELQRNPRASPADFYNPLHDKLWKATRAQGGRLHPFLLTTAPIESPPLRHMSSGSVGSDATTAPSVSPGVPGHVERVDV